jgi:cellulose synthase/poly-beta-1,6-N-acetylglucosamine synthase-like glycosyltransferase
MSAVFWFCLGLVVYTYLGYVVFLKLEVHFRNRPVLEAKITPTVSVIMAAHNEEKSLPSKLDNLRMMEYPRDRLQVIVASDGSTDRTANILREHASTVDSVILESANGKAYAINQAVKSASGEIFVFLDARQRVAPDAISNLVSCFADPSVGAVSGELLLDSDEETQSSDGLGIYWKIEKLVRRLESASGSVVGVTGAIYAIRRSLYTEIPSGTILDDVFVPMHVARQGKRVVFQASALAYDRLSSTKGKEFSRKIRTLTGNYQLLRLAPWLLSASNPLLFRFVSHKLLRLAVPFFLLVILISSAVAQGFFYRGAFWAQLALYFAALLGAVAPSAKKLKPVSIAYTFVMLNIAAAVAFYNFVAGRYKVWT